MAEVKEKRKNLETVIELRNLVKVFDKETVVDDVNLKIRRGEFVTLLGPSGCGKTTILRMIAGFESPASGTVYLEGKDVTSMPPHKRNVNTVFQKYALFPHLDVFNNIAFGLKLKEVPITEEERATKKYKGMKFRRYTKQEIKDKVSAILKLVGLEDYGHRDVDSLSGGQQQRVAIARALVNEPRVLLLDEPLGALDLKMRKEMQQELRRMHRELGITFIYVTHDQEEALTMSDTIVVINDGEIQQVGSPKEIYDRPANAFVADFIGESNILSGTVLSDSKVKLLGKEFACNSKGFFKNQHVDIVVRPEDIVLHKPSSAKTMMKGRVLSSVFMGTYYEKNVESNGYEFTVQSMEEVPAGQDVGLEFKTSNMHIMALEASVNEYETYMSSEDTVIIAGQEFQIFVDEAEVLQENKLQLAKGDPVMAYVEFKNVELTDDEKDGTVGATITHTLYKGTYYQVKAWSDNDTLFIVHTPHEWDIDDRVGVVIKPGHIRIEPMNTKTEGEVTE